MLLQTGEAVMRSIVMVLMVVIGVTFGGMAQAMEYGMQNMVSTPRVVESEYAYQIVVSFSDFMVHVFDRDGAEVFTAPVALPRWTPKLPVEGKLTSIEHSPWWFPPPGVRAYVLKHEGKELPDKVPPGPHNPMGSVKFSFQFFTPGAISLSKLHGTNHPESIGTRASSGCIRMYNEDALALSDLLEPTFRAGGKIAISYVDHLQGDIREVASSQ